MEPLFALAGGVMCLWLWVYLLAHVTKIQTLDEELFGFEKPLFLILLDFHDANDLADENRRSSLPPRPFLLV